MPKPKQVTKPKASKLAEPATPVKAKVLIPIRDSSHYELLIQAEEALRRAGIHFEATTNDKQERIWLLDTLRGAKVVRS